MKMEISAMMQHPMKILEKTESFLKSGKRRIGESSATIMKL